MSENKFTKGGWHLSQSPVRANKFLRPFKSVKNKNTIGGKILANAYGDTPEEAVANAKLISAAPDLLEALQMAYDYMLRTHREEGAGTWFMNESEIGTKCIAAIKKATK